MGLDISVYANVEFAGEYVEGQRLDSYNFVVVVPEYVKTFPRRTLPLKTGYYTGRLVFSFVAGGYSFYNEWRNLLAKAAGYPSDSYVWGNVTDGPFVELIDFYDNEGVLGSEVCRKLFTDFCSAEVLQRAKEFMPELGNHRVLKYFEEKYNNFKKAFELAGEHSGAVVFH